MSKLLSWFVAGITSSTLLPSLYANVDLDLVGREPEQLSSNSGISLGMAGGGVAAIDGVNAVELNPSMIAQSKQYRISGDLFWPAYGRTFYKGNVVDSQTNKVAAGLSYVSSQDDFENYNNFDREKDKDAFLSAKYDGRIKRRVTISLAQSFKYFSLGIQGSHVDGYEPEETAAKPKKARSMSFGIGGAALLTKSLRVAGSISGLGGSKNKDLKPPTRQIGLAWLFAKGDTSLHVDLRQRQRTEQEFQPIDQPFTISGKTKVPSELGDQENMAIVSGTSQIQNVLRVYAGFAQEIGGINRQSAGAGAAIVNQGWTLAYSYQVPYFGDSEPTQALTLGLDMKI